MLGFQLHGGGHPQPPRCLRVSCTMFSWPGHGHRAAHNSKEMTATHVPGEKRSPWQPPRPAPPALAFSFLDVPPPDLFHISLLPAFPLDMRWKVSSSRAGPCLFPLHCQHQRCSGRRGPGAVRRALDAQRRNPWLSPPPVCPLTA